MKEGKCPLWRNKNLLRVLAAMLLFLAVNIPSRVILDLLPYSGVRPSNVLPPVLGILWGPYGAFGTAAANFILDVFVSETPAGISIPGMIVNFIYGYLPFKLWYSFKPSVGPDMGSVAQILRYITVIFIDSGVTTTLLLLIFEHAGVGGQASEVWFLFFNNFDFAVLLGVPILIFASSFPGNLSFSEITAWERKGIIRGRTGLLKEWALAAVIIFGICYYVLYKGVADIAHPGAAGFILWICILFVLVYFRKPSNLMQKDGYRYTINKRTIGARAVSGFLLLSALFVAAMGILCHILLDSNSGFSPLERWTYIYRVVGIAIHVLFAATILFLWYVEQKITNPLMLLTEAVENFAKADHLKELSNEEGAGQKCRQIRTGDELQVLSEFFCKMTEDIQRYVRDLTRVTAEKEKIGAELSVASGIQADMLPNLFPAFPDREEFLVYASMEPAKEVGGDFYDFFLVDDNHLGFVVADVSGKGVPAALFMMMAKILIKNHAQTGEEPAEILGHVNNQLCEGNEAGMFVTAWLGILEIDSGRLCYANAGHTRPLLGRDGKAFDWFSGSGHGFVLGGMENIGFAQAEFEIKKGDVLFLYTDGVTEANNIREELYGENRLIEALNREEVRDVYGLLQCVKKDLDFFVGEAEQFDDITMLFMRYDGKG